MVPSGTLASRAAVPRGKSAQAFRTIGEAALETGVEPHVLRYWESKFSQIRPVKRSGIAWRLYRPEDIALVRRIRQLVCRDGLSLKDVQQLLDGNGDVQARLHAKQAAAIASRSAPRAAVAGFCAAADRAHVEAIRRHLSGSDSHTGQAA